MSSLRLRVGFIAVAMTVTGGALLLPAAPATDGTALKGNIQSASGQSLEGVAVSAREDGKTYTTSVFTDEQGAYSFPALEKGRYRVWAQTVGFQTARAELNLDGAPALRHDFKLQTLADFSKQLTGTEWFASLPEDTAENRRMKLIFRDNCTGCHTPNFVLQNRFDQAGWRKIIDVMETVGIYGDPPRADRAPVPLVREFKDELAAYLGKVRGPGPSPMKWNPFPRPRGEAAQAVITEYDYTSSSNPSEYVTSDGSDWMEGPPSAYEARGVHDVEVDSNGFVWIADSQANPVRTVARLDPRTGEIKNFKLPGDYGMAKRSHGIVIDPKGIAWFNADGGLGKIDTKTEKMEWFNPPKDMTRAGGTLDIDPVGGGICISTEAGALKFDPATDKFTEFKSKSRGVTGRTYGVATDADGNCWWAQMNYDKLGVGNFRTGEITEVALQPVSGVDDRITERDRSLYKFIGSDWNSATPWQQAPRRLGGDKNGNVWVALWWGNALAKIDIRSHKATYYRYPGPGFPGVYDTAIDRNGMVWMNLMNADTAARFDPKTEKWTEFPLPSHGMESRFIAVDNHKDPVEVWVPSWRTHKVARIQFRTQEQLRAQSEPRP